MAVFGAESPMRTTPRGPSGRRCEIIEVIQELNRKPDFGLSIRAAVNTGEGLINLSARLKPEKAS
jgi:hypothetical protein